MVYNTALSSAEVQQLYNYQSPTMSSTYAPTNTHTLNPTDAPNSDSNNKVIPFLRLNNTMSEERSLDLTRLVTIEEVVFKNETWYDLLTSLAFFQQKTQLYPLNQHSPQQHIQQSYQPICLLFS